MAADMVTDMVGSESMLDSCWWFFFMPACYGYYWDLFTNIPPFLWASMGVAVAIGISVLGAAWGIFITGKS